MSKTTRIAHLTDFHFNTMKNVKIKSMLSKRLYGYIFWNCSKGKRFDFSLLNTISLDIKNEKLDYITVTGDISHVSLPSQFIEAKDYIYSLIDSEKISVIPGNHDYYTLSGKKYYGKIFKDFSNLPYVKTFNNIAIFGIDSSIVTPPFFSYGYVKKNQFKKLSKLLESVDKKYFKILLIHHPPVQGITSFKKCLLNSKKMTNNLLCKGDFNLVLHGHTHNFNIKYFDLPNSKIPIVSAAPLFYKVKKLQQAGGYNIYEISHNNERWSVTLRRKIYDYEKNCFYEKTIDLLP